MPGDRANEPPVTGAFLEHLRKRVLIKALVTSTEVAMESMVGVANLQARTVDFFREEDNDDIKTVLPEDLAKIGDPELIHSWLRKEGAISMNEVVLISER